MWHRNFSRVLLPVLLVCAAAPEAHGRAVFAGIPAAPLVPASAYILVDFHTGDVLAEHNADERAEPASLTKIMATYVAAQALQQGLISLTDETTVSEKAWRMEGSRMFIEVGKTVSVDDLLQGVIVQSGNDASVALAEHISGSEDVFAQTMNQQAARIGMSNSAFANSTGLPDANTVVTARDLSKLAIAFIRDFPEIYRRFAVPEFTYNAIRQLNRNRLIAKDKSVDGFKTGHTEAAGYCLVASARRGDMRLISVVLGSGSDAERTAASQSLLNYGFRFFETRKLYSAGDVVASVRVWKGSEDNVDVKVRDDVYIVHPRGKFADVSAKAVVNEPLEAPLSTGDRLGVIQVESENARLANIPLVSARSIEVGSWFSRLVDTIELLFE